MNKFKLKTLLLLGVCLSPLNADYILEYKMNDGIEKILYHNASTAKIVTSNESSTIYKIKEKTYIVNGNTIVDAEEVGNLVNAYSEQNEVKVEKPTYKIEKTSKRVKVAGISGVLWIITGEMEGKPYRQEVVVSNDARIVKVFETMNSMFSAMSGQNTDEIFEITDGYVPIKMDEFELYSFKETSVKSSEYQLPKTAKKQSLPTAESIQGMYDSYKQEHPEDEEENAADMEKAKDMFKSFF